MLDHAAMPSFTKILVAVDFSPHSEAALAMAIDLARRYDAAISVVHVYQPPHLPPPDGYLVMSPAELTDLLGQIERRLESVGRTTREAGIHHVETHLLHGNPAAEIARQARIGSNDLIVIGTHGRTGFKRLVLGSVAERVLHKAPCPVLAVRLPTDPPAE